MKDKSHWLHCLSTEQTEGGGERGNLFEYEPKHAQSTYRNSERLLTINPKKKQKQKQKKKQ